MRRISLQMRYTKPVLMERRRVEQEGTLCERVRFDLVHKPAYAFGVLAAADVARFSGCKRITVAEIGVAEGKGLKNLATIAGLVAAETGIGIDVIGFDNGTGRPKPLDHRDHPETWAEGDFAMGDPERLRAELPLGTRLVLGDVAETIPQFLSELSAEAPLGFCAFDVDYYSSTRAALQIYDGAPHLYLPVSPAFFDDTLGGPTRIASLFRHSKGGQLLAIDEFNQERPARCIDSVRTLPYRRPLHLEKWLAQTYAVHVLDHSLRSEGRRITPISTEEINSEADTFWPL